MASRLLSSLFRSNKKKASDFPSAFGLASSLFLTERTMATVTAADPPAAAAAPGAADEGQRPSKRPCAGGVKLVCLSPVPSDIDIAHAASPLHISRIAESLGLKEEEYDMYGKTMAKVS